MHNIIHLCSKYKTNKCLKVGVELFEWGTIRVTCPYKTQCR